MMASLAQLETLARHIVIRLLRCSHPHVSLLSARSGCCKVGDKTPPTELVKKVAQGQLKSTYQDVSKVAKEGHQMTIFSESYDFVVTLLLLENRDGWVALASERDHRSMLRLPIAAMIRLRSSWLTLAIGGRLRYCLAPAERPLFAKRSNTSCSRAGARLALVVFHQAAARRPRQTGRSLPPFGPTLTHSGFCHRADGRSAELAQ